VDALGLWVSAVLLKGKLFEINFQDSRSLFLISLQFFKCVVVEI